MKKLLFSFLILLNIQSNAQEAILSSPGTTMAFNGFENPINISYPGIEQKKLIFTSADSNTCKVFKRSEQLILYPEDHAKKSCEIYVQYQKGRRLRTLDTVSIPVMKLPKGKASLGNLGSIATVVELLEQDSLIYTSMAPRFDKDFVISSYHVLVMPKYGYMEDMNCTGPRIQESLKRLFQKCQPGDMIVFDGIRVGPANIPLTPITINISKYHNTNYSSQGFRITGYIRKDNKLVPYYYPKTENENYGIKGVKDSIWRDSKYDHRYSEFMVIEETLYDNGKIVAKTFYTDSNYRLHYKLEYVNDSFCRFESYHRNGKKYQKGHVMLNTTHREFRNSTYYNYYYIKKKEEYEYHLEQMPAGVYPNEAWEVFDSIGKKLLSISWDYIEDSTYWNEDHTDPPVYQLNIKHYIIIPVKEYILYKSDGTVEKRVHISR